MIKNRTFIGICLCLLACVTVAASKKRIKVWNFDSEKPDEMASGLTSVSGEWKVIAFDGAPSKPNVLAQVGSSTEKAYNIAFFDEVSLRNFGLTLKFHSVGGDIDQGVGVVFRALDDKNYYLCRYNPLEANMRLYKVRHGERTVIHSVENIDETPGWQTLRIVTNAARIEGHMNGQVQFSVVHEELSEAGKLGLWTKADARTYFDDIELEFRDKP